MSNDNSHPFGMAQANDLMPNRTPGTREVLFREKMEPLVEQLKELAKAAGIPMIAAFELDTHELPDVGDAIVCHVASQGVEQADGNFLPPRHPGMLVAGNVLGPNPRPELVMLGKMMRMANAEERTGGRRAELARMMADALRSGDRAAVDAATDAICTEYGGGDE